MTTIEKHEKTLTKDIRTLLIGLKPQIDDEYRCSDDKDDTTPGMQVTIGAGIEDGELSWDYQTGDTSYTGGAYSYRHWATIYLYRRSNCTSLAKDAARELMSEIAQDDGE